MGMITNIEDFFTLGCGRCERFATPDCSTRQWIEGLDTLRRLCRDAGLTETVKWAHPCYMHAGRNVAIIGAFRNDYRLTFFNAALMTDPESVLQKQGPNTRHNDMLRFTHNQGPAQQAELIAAYLREAMRYAEEGILPPREDATPDWPEELAEALEADPELAEAFAALTPGRQKSYVINLNGAKTATTRHARIARFRDHIIAGKGVTER